MNVGFSPGTQLSVNFDNSRYSTDATRYTYNPFVNSSLGFTITQPLLQGFGRSLNKRYIRIARNSQKVADLVFRQQVIDTVSGIARLYTDLVSLNEDVKVKQEALRLAERLYEDNKNQVDQGNQAPIEVTRANAAVAASRQALITARGTGAAAGTDCENGYDARRTREPASARGPYHSSPTPSLFPIRNRHSRWRTW